MKIVIANDHRGVVLKNKLKKYLEKKKIEVVDLGAQDENVKVDYPEYGYKAGTAIVNKEADFGIVICGTGIGISIACNKVKGARCAKVDNVREALLTRKDNDANVLALNGSMPGYRAKDIVDTFLKTEFVPIERYENRIKQISNFEQEPELEIEITHQEEPSEDENWDL